MPVTGIITWEMMMSNLGHLVVKKGYGNIDALIAKYDKDIIIIEKEVLLYEWVYLFDELIGGYGIKGLFDVQFPDIKSQQEYGVFGFTEEDFIRDPIKGGITVRHELGFRIAGSNHHVLIVMTRSRFKNHGDFNHPVYNTTIIGSIITPLWCSYMSVSGVYTGRIRNGRWVVEVNDDKTCVFIHHSKHPTIPRMKGRICNIQDDQLLLYMRSTSTNTSKKFHIAIIPGTYRVSFYYKYAIPVSIYLYKTSN